MNYRNTNSYRLWTTALALATTAIPGTAQQPRSRAAEASTKRVRTEPRAVRPATVPATPSIVSVTCRVDAEVRGTKIWLRDVADVDARIEPELLQQLTRLELGPRPGTGFHRVFSQQDVLLRLVSAGIPASRIRMNGARQIVVSPRTTTISAQDLLDQAEPVIRGAIAQASGRGQEIEIEAPTKIRALAAPPGRDTFALVASLENGIIGFSHATIRVNVVVDGEVWRTVRLPYRLRRFTNFLTLRRPVRKGEPLGYHNVAQTRLPAVQGTSPWLADLGTLAGKVAARKLDARSKLTIHDLANPAVIRKNDAVDIIAKRGRVLVSSRGVALQDGAVGDRIMVQNFQSGRPLPVVVRGAGIVVVTNGRPNRLVAGGQR